MLCGRAKVQPTLCPKETVQYRRIKQFVASVEHIKNGTKKIEISCTKDEAIYASSKWSNKNQANRVVISFSSLIFRSFGDMEIGFEPKSRTPLILHSHSIRVEKREREWRTWAEIRKKRNDFIQMEKEYAPWTSVRSFFFFLFFFIDVKRRQEE